MMKRTHKRVTKKLRAIVERAEETATMLTSTLGHLNFLLKDGYFSTLMRAEGLTTFPEPLAAAIYCKVTQEIVGDYNPEVKCPLVKGLHPEIIDAMRNRHYFRRISIRLRKMKAGRQIEVLRLMNEAQNHSLWHADILLAATARNKLVNPRSQNIIPGISPFARAEMENLQRRYFQIETTYARNHLNLQIAKCYISKLLKNEKIARHLLHYHCDRLKALRVLTG